jgi:hypothetical protein
MDKKVIYIYIHIYIIWDKLRNNLGENIDCCWNQEGAGNNLIFGLRNGFSRNLLRQGTKILATNWG